MFARVLILLAFAASVSASDQEKRDRDAEAILAIELELQKQKRPALVSYADAEVKSLANGKTVVAFPEAYRNPICPPGAICAKSSADEVWICVPRDGKMVVVKTLPVTATDEEVLKAFREAAPKPMQKPDPFFIDLQLGLMVGQVCPGGQCPAAARPVPVTVADAVPQVMPGPGPVYAERPRLFNGVARDRVRCFFSRFRLR